MSMFNHGSSRTRVIGNSQAIRHVEHDALIAARGDTHILITGEPGVGKGVLARFIHENSDRSPRRFATITCQGVPDLLFESELFGHVEGSFVGTYSDKPGLLKAVAGGTVFIEEISALSVAMQSRLLRFLEAGEYVRIDVDRIEFRHRVRLIASTTANLKARVAGGLFLDHLYERLSGSSITVPPLRERRDDIPWLVDHFARYFAEQTGQERAAEISGDVREALCQAEWPGNVQQLKAAVLRQLLAGPSGPAGPAGPKKSIAA